MASVGGHPGRPPDPQTQPDAVAAFLDRHNLGTRTDRPARVQDVVTQRPGHGRVVHDRGRGGVQRGHPTGMRFIAAQAARVQHGRVRDAVGAGAVGDVGKPAQLAAVNRYDDLSALVVADAVGSAVLLEQRDTASAQCRLQRAGLVVEPGVDHPAVAPGLMPGDVVFLLEDRDGGARIDLSDPSGHRQPHNPTADDRDPTRHVSCLL